MLFISYSSKDADMAFQLVDCLEQNNIPCWIAPRDIIPGSTYPSQIVKAIRECNGFVLIASDHVNHSNHVNSEVARAFDQKKPIYPFFVEKTVFSDDFIYFLGQIQWINAFDSFEAGLHSLVEAVKKVKTPKDSGSEQGEQASNVSAIETVPEKPSGVRIATYQDLTEAGYSALDIAKRLVENDYKLYPGMVVENEGEPEQWAGYLSTYPETFRYLVNEKDEIIGNWSFLAVSEDIHEEKLAAGMLAESTFTLDETEYLLFPGDYVGYLLNMSINEGYNSMANLNLLLDAFVEQMLSFAEDDIFFKAWYVNVFRKDHEAMYRKLGFRYLLNNTTFGKVYYLNCIANEKKPGQTRSSASPLMRKNKKLMEIYYDHFITSASD